MAQIFIEVPFHLFCNASADSEGQDPSFLTPAVLRGGLCRAAVSIAGTICVFDNLVACTGQQLNTQSSEGQFCGTNAIPF